MNRWFFLLTFGLTNLSLLATEQGKDIPVLKLGTPNVQAQLPEIVPDDGGIRDTLGPVSLRPVPDEHEELPPCFEQVDYLTRHDDTIMAISYLRQVVANADLLPQFRSRAILQLADLLNSQHQPTEELSWLKIWQELFPSRPEYGAVTYRIASLYSQMGLSELARDTYYLSLARTVNDGQVQNAQDLKYYSRLTDGTLWAMAANEYKAGQWDRAAELFARYRKEANSAAPLSLEKAAFLQADCYYQSKKTDEAQSLYEETLKQHPFNPLALEARLRLFHLYVIHKQPEKAGGELESLVWTVRTVYPKQETFWQKKTAEFLLALNHDDATLLPPLLQKSSEIMVKGKSWQEALNHYDVLVSYTAANRDAIIDNDVNSSRKISSQPGLSEEQDLSVMNRNLNQLLPPSSTKSTN